jgi:hypothetical protein
MSSPVVTWQQVTINGINYLEINTSLLRVPLDWDPSQGLFIAVGEPAGGFGSFPALVKGDPGPTPLFDTTINLTVLGYTDPTPDSAGLTLLGVSGGVPTYQASLSLHEGPPGTDGISTLDPTAYGDPITGFGLVYSASDSGFVYQAPLCGDRYIPATINSAPSGNPTWNLCAVAIPALNFDWRPHIEGQAIVTGAGGSNVAVDLVARLNNQSSGNVVGQGIGLAGAGPFQNVMSSGPPAGSSDSYDRIYAGASAVIYFNAERSSGTDTFTTSSSSSQFSVRVCPIPGTGMQPAS